MVSDDERRKVATPNGWLAYGCQTDDREKEVDNLTKGVGQWLSSRH